MRLDRVVIGMRLDRVVIFGLFILIGITSCKSQKKEIENGEIKTKVFEVDTVSLIRNPGMGWTIYDDAHDQVADAKEYWIKQDTIAKKYASVLYLRWRWSEMEPEEGKYAWEYDENFKSLVQGALDRNLRLAFRVYVSGQDNVFQTTPEFVFDQGAKFYMEKGGDGEVKSPYPDDPIFQEKFKNFIQAFAKEFDNPLQVDYIDGYNLGWWGEGHHLRFIDEENREKTFKWIIDLYGNTFKNVPLVITVDSEIGHDLELIHAINGQGYAVRRDGYASTWMPEAQKDLLRGLFPKSFVVAECCYWQDRSIESVNKIERVYNWDSWADYYKQVVNEALETHANYLDLRENVESVRWTRDANLEVHRFIKKGGYRIAPTEISYALKNEKLTIKHSWKNFGVGVVPNNNRRWNYKFKVNFVLLDKNDTVIKNWLDVNAEPSAWIGKDLFKYVFEVETKKLNKGNYKLAVAILADSETDKRKLNLALLNPDLIDNKYNFIGKININ